jgi:hypothetical protein
MVALQSIYNLQLVYSSYKYHHRDIVTASSISVLLNSLSTENGNDAMGKE